jgi:dihydroneopterin aldolase
MGIIAIEGMEFHAYHGCFEEEQLIGTKFIIDLYFETDTSKAEASDQLADTINYAAAFQLVKTEMDVSSKLLEHVGRRILNSLKQTYPQIEWAEVKVSKMNPPLGGQMESVSVIISTDDDE